MQLRTSVAAGFAAFLFVSTVFAWQRGFRRFQYEEEDHEAAIPAGADRVTEFFFTRLRYPSMRWSWGYRGSWTTDFPKADRQFIQGVQRLTRIDVCPAERVADVDTDEIFNYPWIYGVEVGHWQLDETQARRLREYLQRGGFLFVDDFHGTWEWESFMESMRRVFPDRPVVDVEDTDALFHVLYDLDERFQVPGIQYWYTGRAYEKDGIEPKWRAIYDDKGRAMVAICQNMDLGDAWEWADHPRYPERYASLAYRTGINYIIYAMTH